MKTKKIPYIKSPCKNCPFRRDSQQGWLGERRMMQILDSASFVCHKKTDHQCAGHMLIKKEANLFFRMASILGIELKLSGRDLVFGTEKSCISHHKN